MRVVVLGAGGHAQVVADALMRAHERGAEGHPLGYLDDDPSFEGSMLLGLPVLGRLADLGQIAHEAVVVAIGDNGTRRRLYEHLIARGERFAVVRHPSAVVAPDVKVGPGAMILAGVVINPGSVIGANVILNTGSTVDHHNHIGDHAHVAPGVHLGGEVSIGEGTLVGIGATVIPRCTVGAWSVVGAGACVIGPVPGRTTVVGVPARPLSSSERKRP